MTAPGFAHLSIEEHQYIISLLEQAIAGAELAEQMIRNGEPPPGVSPEAERLAVPIARAHAERARRILEKLRGAACAPAPAPTKPSA